MKWDRIISGLVAAAIGLAFWFVVSSSEPAVGQNLCGNKCISSADCMEGCVCMDTDGSGMGVCVSFN